LVEKGRNGGQKLFQDIDLMGRILGAKWLRHQVISNNIANVDTPNYKRYDVSFEDLLQSKLNHKRLELGATNNRHITARINYVTPKIYRETESIGRNDRNNVDIDKEMVELAENALSYDILAEQIRTKFQLLSTAINERR